MRRTVLFGLVVLALLMAACSPQTVVVKETVVVEKEVEKEVTKEVIKEVEKEVTKVVEGLLADGFDPIVFCRFIPTAEYVGAHLAEALGKTAEVGVVTGTLPPDGSLS